MPKFADLISMMTKVKEETEENQSIIKITRQQIKSGNLDEKEKAVINFIKEKWKEN